MANFGDTRSEERDHSLFQKSNSGAGPGENRESRPAHGASGIWLSVPCLACHSRRAQPPPSIGGIELTLELLWSTPGEYCDWARFRFHACLAFTCTHTINKPNYLPMHPEVKTRTHQEPQHDKSVKLLSAQTRTEILSPQTPDYLSQLRRLFTLSHGYSSHEIIWDNRREIFI